MKKPWTRLKAVKATRGAPLRLPAILRPRALRRWLRIQNLNMHLTVPFEPVVGISEVSLLIDLCPHPFFEPKYKYVVQSIRGPR